ncbi:hypothetical protein AX16_004011 [Volvariella volvacea WC 439]|nr:hypothetical protein AX16_004011 [Volvariella volvacea WC 439]
MLQHSRPTSPETVFDDITNDVDDLDKDRQFPKILAPRGHVQFFYPASLLFGTREDRNRQPLLCQPPEFGKGSGFQGMGITGRTEEEIVASMPPAVMAPLPSDTPELDPSPSCGLRKWNDSKIVFKPMDRLLEADNSLATPTASSPFSEEDSSSLSDSDMGQDCSLPVRNEPGSVSSDSVERTSSSLPRKSPAIRNLIHDDSEIMSVDSDIVSPKTFKNPKPRKTKSSLPMNIKRKEHKHQSRTKTKCVEKPAKPKTSSSPPPPKKSRPRFVPYPLTSTSSLAANAPLRRVANTSAHSKSDESVARKSQTPDLCNEKDKSGDFLGDAAGVDKNDLMSTDIDAVFRNKKTGRYHCTRMLIGTEERCSKTFTRKNDVVRHIGSSGDHVQAGEMERPYCRYCDQSFPRPDSLRRHFKSKQCQDNKRRYNETLREQQQLKGRAVKSRPT